MDIFASNEKQSDEKKKERERKEPTYCIPRCAHIYVILREQADDSTAQNTINENEQTRTFAATSALRSSREGRMACSTSTLGPLRVAISIA